MNTITVEVQAELVKEGNYFVVYCPALELTSYGTSEELAKERFSTELKIFFEETAKKGTLEKLLLQLGWSLRKKPKPKYQPPENIEIPHYLLEKTIGPFTERIAIPV